MAKEPLYDGLWVSRPKQGAPMSFAETACARDLSVATSVTIELLDAFPLCPDHAFGPQRMMRVLHRLVDALPPGVTYADAIMAMHIYALYERNEALQPDEREQLRCALRLYAESLRKRLLA